MTADDDDSVDRLGELDASLFRVLAYLIGSAGATPEETLSLASFRMLDAATRLISMAEGSEAFGSDPFLARVREEIGANMNKVMWDQAGFLRWLPELERAMVLEARRRNLSEPAAG